MFDDDLLQAAIDGLDDDADEAAVRAAIGEELGRQAHARWLDEPVPALGGVTPREAAADPTRRDQLECLLDEFEERGSRMAAASEAGEGFVPFSYDVPALRRELGLDG